MDIIEHQALTTANKCGLSLFQLLTLSELNSSKLKEDLMDLHSKKLITVRQGINSKLIFKND